MSVATAYYRKADGVILVFDVTNEKSFVNIQSRWMDAIMSEDWFVKFLLCNIYIYHISRIIGKSNIWRFAQITQLAEF